MGVGGIEQRKAVAATLVYIVMEVSLAKTSCLPSINFMIMLRWHACCCCCCCRFATK